MGVDESPPYVEFATQQAESRLQNHANFYQGDVTNIDQVLTEQGIEEGSFDIAYIRWVMCFVSDPVSTINAIAKMLKPGGKLLIQDYFNYSSMCVAPRSEVFETIIQAIGKSWSDHGGDPDIMSQLPGIALDAGFSVPHIARVEIGTARPGSTMWNWPETFWPVFLPRLVDLGYITQEDHQAFLKVWQDRSNNPGAYMHLPPVYELMAIKQ